jgi:hypothetical protein
MAGRQPKKRWGQSSKFSVSRFKPVPSSSLV